jgi:hypothetical protein
MIGSIAATAGAIALLIWLALAHGRRPRQRRPPSPAAGTAILVASASAAVLPPGLALPRIFTYPVDSLLIRLAQAGYWRWTLNTLFVFGLAAMVAALIVIPAHAAGVRHYKRLLAASFIIGAAVTPLWYWIVLRWQAAAQGTPGVLAAALASGLSAGLIALWPASAMASHRHQERRRLGKAGAVTAFITALVVANQFALGAAVASGRSSHTISTGAALRLAGADSLLPLLEASSLATFVLALAASFILLQWVRRLDDGELLR